MQIRIGRTTFEISVWFFASLAALLVLDRSMTGALSICAVILHEGGHLFAMYLLEVPPNRVKFRAFGILLDTAWMRSLSYGREAIVLLSGPAANFLTASVCLLISSDAQIRLFGAVNLAIGVFNLLPFAVLDGGSLLTLIIRRQSMTGRGERIADLCVLVLLIPVFLISLMMCLSGKVNFTLPVILLVAILASIRKTST